MKVRILTHTPEPEKLIAAAAKLCYASAEIDELLDGLTAEKTASFNMLRVNPEFCVNSLLNLRNDV